MFRDFEALREIKAPIEYYWISQVGILERKRRNHKAAAIDIGSIEAIYLRASILPHTQPSALAAAKINNAAHLNR